jgi:hypothetical protein
VLCTGVAVDEIFHVHPAAGAGSPQANPISFTIGDLSAADTKEFHLVLAGSHLRCLGADGLFRGTRGWIARERCRTGKRG